MWERNWWRIDLHLLGWSVKFPLYSPVCCYNPIQHSFDKEWKLEGWWAREKSGVFFAVVAAFSTSFNNTNFQILTCANNRPRRRVILQKGGDCLCDDKSIYQRTGDITTAQFSLQPRPEYNEVYIGGAFQNWVHAIDDNVVTRYGTLSAFKRFKSHPALKLGPAVQNKKRLAWRKQVLS